MEPSGRLAGAPLEGAAFRLSAPSMALGTSAALIVVYFALLVWLAPGGAFGDDLDIARAVDQARGSADAWSPIWAQHNEHRLVTTKLVFWAQHALIGGYDFTSLAFMGNLFLLPVFALLARRALQAPNDMSGPLLVFTTAAVFNYSSADSMLWAMAALSNYMVIAFALAALWMLSRARMAWDFAALAPALLAAISQGNGLLVPLLGAANLLIARRWLQAAVWCVATIVIFAGFFDGYQLLRPPSDALESAGRLPQLAVFALAFSGSALGYPTENTALLTGMLTVSSLLGVCLWAAVAFIFIRHKERRLDPLLWLALFLIGSGAMAAVGRVDGGLIQALVPRYHVNSCLLITCIVLMSAPAMSGKLRNAARSASILAAVSLAYLAATTLILWRMHTFYSANVGA